MGETSGIVPTQRLWTPWRMTYVGGAREPGCVFCNALVSDDDVASLVVHRGEHAFVILNLYPYNTGHLMVVPNHHVDEPAALAAAARMEVAELTASFCTGLRFVMGCDGLNAGMNLGSAAGAGIADHLHQHLVPRWRGDANFMPIVSGTKVLPELLPATYGKLRAEVARQKSKAGSVIVAAFTRNREHVVLEGDALLRVTSGDDTPLWKAALGAVSPLAVTCEILGWAGAPSTESDENEPPALAMSFDPGENQPAPYRLAIINEAEAALPDHDRMVLGQALARFG